MPLFLIVLHAVQPKHLPPLDISLLHRPLSLVDQGPHDGEVEGWQLLVDRRLFLALLNSCIQMMLQLLLDFDVLLGQHHQALGVAAVSVWIRLLDLVHEIQA